MKTVISYVSGTGGDFVVNCCNAVWDLPLTDTGSVVASASIKRQERRLNDHDLMQVIDSMPFDYVGSHSIDRLLHLPVRPLWLMIPDRDQLWTWTVRDCVTRQADNLMGRHGTVYEGIADLVHSDRAEQAAERYLDWLHQFNWTLMQMRLVQLSNKVDVSRLLTVIGIQDLLDQLPELQQHHSQCRQFHAAWLRHQLPVQDRRWVVTHLAKKLTQMVNSH